MSKPVKSTDPRKKTVVMKLKQESRSTKVTNVKDSGFGRFEGDCMIQKIGGHEWLRLGRFFVQFELNPDGSLGSHVNGGKINEEVSYTAVPKGGF